MTDEQIRWRLRSGRWRRLEQGVFDTCGQQQPDLPTACLAKLRRLPTGTIVSHLTAAQLWRLDGARPWRAGDVLHTTCATTHRGSRPGCRVHRGSTAEFDVVSGVPVTTLSKVVLDCARTLSLAEAVSLGDSALRADPGIGALLPAELERCHRWPGSEVARQVLGLLDPHAANPLESRARVLWHVGGLPAPRTQAVIRDDGRFVARVDFLWDRARVIGEVDGLSKYADRFEIAREKTRQNALVALGYTVFRFTWDDVVRRPDYCLAVLRAALGI